MTKYSESGKNSCPSQTTQGPCFFLRFSPIFPAYFTIILWNRVNPYNVIFFRVFWYTVNFFQTEDVSRKEWVIWIFFLPTRTIIIITCPNTPFYRYTRLLIMYSVHGPQLPCRGTVSSGMYIYILYLHRSLFLFLSIYLSLSLLYTLYNIYCGWLLVFVAVLLVRV